MLANQAEAARPTGARHQADRREMLANQAETARPKVPGTGQTGRSDRSDRSDGGVRANFGALSAIGRWLRCIMY
jgi:hypothetical protein